MHPQDVVFGAIVGLGLYCFLAMSRGLRGAIPQGSAGGSGGSRSRDRNDRKKSMKGSGRGIDDRKIGGSRGVSDRQPKGRHSEPRQPDRQAPQRNQPPRGQFVRRQPDKDFSFDDPQDLAALKKYANWIIREFNRHSRSGSDKKILASFANAEGDFEEIRGSLSEDGYAILDNVIWDGIQQGELPAPSRNRSKSRK